LIIQQFARLVKEIADLPREYYMDNADLPREYYMGDAAFTREYIHLRRERVNMEAAVKPPP